MLEFNADARAMQAGMDDSTPGLALEAGTGGLFDWSRWRAGDDLVALPGIEPGFED